MPVAKEIEVLFCQHSSASTSKKCFPCEELHAFVILFPYLKGYFGWAGMWGLESHSAFNLQSNLFEFHAVLL